MNKKLSIENIAYYSILIILSVIILAHIYTIYAFPSLGPDSGFYLKTSYDLANGLEFYNNFNNSYTPLSMYINSIPYYFLNSVSLELAFTWFLLIYVILAIVFYKVAGCIFNKSKRVLILSTFLFIAILFVLEGVHILLEPYVILFQFLALYVILKSNLSNRSLFLGGIFVFLSFFSKQYGLFVIPGILFLIFSKVSNFKAFTYKGLLFFLGILVSIVLSVTYYCFYKDSNVKDFLFQLLGLPALSGEEVMTNIGYSYRGLFERTKWILRMFPFLAAFIFFIPLILKRKIQTNQLFTLIIFISSCSVLLFAYYPHYYQLIIPYAILSLLSLSLDSFKKYKYVYGLLFLVFFRGTYLEYKKTYNYKMDTYKEQTYNIALLSKYLNKGDKVYLQAISPGYYFLCKYDSPNYSKLGYKFPNELSLEMIHKRLPPNSYIIADTELRTNTYFKDYILHAKVSLKQKDVVILKKNF